MAGRLLPLSTYAELPQWFWEVKRRATPPLVPSVVMGNPPLVPLVPSVAVGNSLLVRLVPPPLPTPSQACQRQISDDRNILLLFRSPVKLTVSIPCTSRSNRCGVLAV